MDLQIMQRKMHLSIIAGRIFLRVSKQRNFYNSQGRLFTRYTT